MAKSSNMRWLNLTAGKKLPKNKEARKRVEAKIARQIAKQSGLVTVRKATPEELARLKGIRPIKSVKKTPKRGQLPP